ncbi:MAG TPA: type III secretion system chaperone [Ramlibacter sp.]|nr:type III secretion system chaperone [Ramlibacter sp.]
MTPQEELVGQLATHLQLPSLALDADHACALAFPDGLQVDLRFLPPRPVFRFCATLGVPIAERKEEFMAGLLLTNLVFGEQGEPCFAMNQASGAVLLCRNLSYAQLAVQVVADDIARLVNAAREFRQLFAHQQMLAM